MAAEKSSAGAKYRWRHNWIIDWPYRLPGPALKLHRRRVRRGICPSALHRLRSGLKLFADRSIAMSVHSVETKTVCGACPQDCPDTCAFLYHVEDGKLVDVTGDPNHPMTRGGLCVKLKNFAEHHYNPDRVLYPMKRVGPKGSGKYERIGWDEALSTIKSKWTGIIDQYGSQAIMPHAYLGNQG